MYRMIHTDRMLRNDYKKIRIIGHGSYGEVWLCRSRCDRQRYVMKKMHIDNDEHKEAAERERNLLCSLHHRNIVLYKDCYVDRNAISVVMEYCSGGSIADRINKQGSVRFEEEQIIRWVVHICSALQYLHNQDIIHRDLKPQNILLSSNDVAKLCDFGISRQLNAGELANTLTGTRLYLSPEILGRRPYDSKTDIWSLGCCVYEMMTFKPAIDPEHLVFQAIQSIGEMPADWYSADLIDLTCQMMSMDPASRPTAADILNLDLCMISCLEGHDNAALELYPEEIDPEAELAMLTSDDSESEDIDPSKAVETVNEELQCYVCKRRETAAMLRIIADKLQGLHNRVLVTRVASASIGIAGGITAGIATVAAVLTGGLLAPVVVGVVAGCTSAAAGVSSLVAQGIQKLLESSEMKNTKTIIDEAEVHRLKVCKTVRHYCRADVDPELTDTLREICQTLTRETDMADDSFGSESLQSVDGSYTASTEILKADSNDNTLTGSGTSTTAEKVVIGGKISGTVVSGANAAATGAVRVASAMETAASGAVRTLTVGGKVLGVTGIGLAVVGVGVDIWQLVDASMKLAQKDANRASQNLVETADAIEAEAERLEEFRLTDKEWTSSDPTVCIR